MRQKMSLDQNGNPISQLALALAGRTLAENCGDDQAHLYQSLSPKIRRFSKAFKRFVNQLEKVTPPFPGKDAPIEPLLSTFRTLIYDSTELFDFYAQVLPNRLMESRPHKSIGKDYKVVAKRLRSRWALMCNLLKHDTCDVAYTCGVSANGVAATHGFMFVRAVNGDQMVIDTDIHNPPERRTSFLKALHELLHHTFRIDINAAKAIQKLPHDPAGTAFSDINLSFDLGHELTWLARQKVFGFNESPMFDAVLVLPEELRLIRRMAAILPGPASIMTSHQADGQTRTFPFA